MTTHLEVERKFDLAMGAPLPDLLRVDGVSQVEDSDPLTLDAVYFDSDARDLSARGISLRRRTGGADEGWHLKRPVRQGDNAVRTEVRVPLDEPGAPTEPSGAVPATLLQQVVGLLRGRELQPIVRIRTVRREHQLVDDTGCHLAVVADDSVVADRLTDAGSAPVAWREVEVELIDGEREVLDVIAEAFDARDVRPSPWPSKLKRALSGPNADPGDARIRGEKAAGMKRTGTKRTGQVVSAHLHDQIDRMVALDPAVRDDAPDAVHQMRVATRRIRSALATFRPVLHRTATDPVRDELKWLGAVLGRARDAEVLRDRLVESSRSLPDELALGPVTRRLDFELRERHRDAMAGVWSALDEPRYFALLDALDALAADPPLRPRARRRADDQLSDLLRREGRRVERRVSAVARSSVGPDRQEALHDLRKAAKRARYAGEAAENPLGRRAIKFAAAMEDLQDALGEHQDSVSARAVLREIGIDAHLAGENGFTFGLLYGLEEQRSQQALADLDRLARRATKRSRAL